MAAIAIVILGIFAIWKRRRTRLRRDLANGAKRARSPLEPDEAGQDPGIYAVAARHSPVEMRSGVPGPGEEESASFGHGPSAFGSASLLNPSALTTNTSVLPEQQPYPYYPYFPSGRRSPSPGEARPSFPQGLSEGSHPPPAYISASHTYLRLRTPSPVFGGPLISVPGPSTGHVVSGQGAPTSPYAAVIFSDSKQPSSEGHGHNSSMENKRGLASMSTPPGQGIVPPTVGYAYEPEPVTWSHRIVDASPVSSQRGHPSPASSLASPRGLQTSTVQQDPRSNRSSMTNLTASVYSQDWEPEPDVRPTLRVTNDPRISPELGLRLRGSHASEHSFGPQDDEDWTRRVGVGHHPCSPLDLC